MSTPSLNPTERFSDRVENYVRFRPGYPDDLLDTIVEETGLSPGSSVADIGAGTGISTELLLRAGCTVHAVEPNEAMRSAAEARLAGNPRFHGIVGRAEATGLPRGSIDLVTAGQAFHWFDPEPTRREFVRILRRPGWVALFWNSRLTDTTPFLRAYEALLHAFGLDYGEINHRNLGAEQLRAFFPTGYRYFTFSNSQDFDFDGLRGRLLSSSYAPPPGHPRHEPMLAQLRELFDEYREEGRVEFQYATELYVGKLRG